LPFTVSAMAVGSFMFDRNPGLQMALLAADGTIHIAAHNGFDPRAVSAEEFMARRQAVLRGSPGPLQVSQSVRQTAGWRVVESFASVAPFNDTGQVPVLMRTRISSNGGDDVMALNAAASQMVVISHANLPEGAATFVPGEVSVRAYTGVPVAALPMRVNIDGRAGIVTLDEKQIAPTVFAPMAANVYDVTGTGDTSPIPSCTFNSTTGHFDCPTLRGAVLASNANTGVTNTINVPAGTYTLTIAKVAGDFTGNHGALYVNNSVNIMGAGQNSTIIQAGATAYNAGTPDGVDMVMAVNQDISSFTTATASIRPASGAPAKPGVPDRHAFRLTGWKSVFGLLG